MKIDIADGFYRINLNINDIPKLGVVFSTLPGEEPLISLPLVLPIGRKNSPPVFSTAAETSADLAKQRLVLNQSGPSHPLEDLVHSIESPTAAASFPTFEDTCRSARPNTS